MKKVLHAEYIFILLLVTINMVIGIATLSDYGESWDEARLYLYGDQSINAYRAVFDPQIHVDFGDDDLRYYGPAYFMGMSILVRTASNIIPDIPTVDLWHLGNFVILQLGLLCFYFLARRFVNVLPALAATALFATQPLIWGHGFINPKDIPFMVFITASIYCGLRMVDDFQAESFEIRRLLSHRWFYAAAMTLGLTISIRILGFAAGIIVLFYLASINVNKVLRLSYVYFGAALAVSFFTWPYLWSSPVSNFIKGIYAMLKFQWVGHALFNGTYYPSNQLPRHYVPQLFSMQLTETALLLFIVGLAVLMLPQLRKGYKSVSILFMAWFVIPFLYILINGMNLYDNTRQLLFIFPAAFLVIAAGLDKLLSWIRPGWAQALLIALLIFPGAAGILKYHPFEYTYYNSSTTSSQQIFRNFETDYWATSFKQASLYLNGVAPHNALVIVWGPSQVVQRYARQDLQVKSFDELKDTQYATSPYYLILTTRYDMDLKTFPEIAPIYSIRHNGSTLSVIKYITPEN